MEIGPNKKSHKVLTNPFFMNSHCNILWKKETENAEILLLTLGQNFQIKNQRKIAYFKITHS